MTYEPVDDGVPERNSPIESSDGSRLHNRGYSPREFRVRKRMFAGLMLCGLICVVAIKRELIPITPVMLFTWATIYVLVPAPRADECGNDPRERMRKAAAIQARAWKAALPACALLVAGPALLSAGHIVAGIVGLTAGIVLGAIVLRLLARRVESAGTSTRDDVSF